MVSDLYENINQIKEFAKKRDARNFVLNGLKLVAFVDENPAFLSPPTWQSACSRLDSYDQHRSRSRTCRCIHPTLF